MNAKGFLLRVFAIGIIAALVVVAATAGAVLTPPSSGVSGAGLDAPPDRPEYEPSRLNPDRVPATGSVLAALDDEAAAEKQILIDIGHNNRINRETLQPLVGALVNRGHEVRYLTEDEELDGDLEAADAFIVADPRKRYDDAELGRVEGFVANGGRLLILAEPNRKSISIGIGISVSTERSRVTGLAGRFGMDIGTTYLHNMKHYDGTHEQVIVRPTDDADLPGVDRAVVDTAAPITAPDAEVLLRAAPGTNRSGIDEPAQYPVAVRDDGVMAVGDVSLLTPESVHVADNEAVAAGMVRFLTGGEKDPRDRPTRTAGPPSSNATSGSTSTPE